MEGSILRVFCTLLLCSPASVFSTVELRHRSGLGVSSLSRNVPVNRSRYPLYMMQLYRSFRVADWSSDAAGGLDDELLQGSDAVLSLTAGGCYQVGERWTVTFDMSSVSTSELVQRAEIRIRLPALSSSKSTTVDLYHSRKESCEPNTLCQDGRLFLGSFSTSASSSKSSWKVFNVTALLKYWLYQGERVAGQEDSGESDVDQGSGAEDSSSFLKRQRLHHPTTNRVVMVIFSKHNEPQEGKAAYSLLHTVENSKYVTAGGVHHDSQGRRHKRNKMERLRGAEAEEAVTRGNSSGRRRARPEDALSQGGHRFNAYRCEGECPTPLDESFNPSNHAYMQSLLRHHHPHRVSCPSCVPTRLSPLSMLYFESDDLTLRHHEDMIVEECGCQ
ncbi:hypothetical protein fugu_003852 [Takifugu bimaculatus]|uniref:TGF-beta family profile domain-containing protein n=1 Tax=Takifugu bimaculatus TaxID=433685 RepID=A0A4Z2BD90_9TELE|nr:hypothetical protein fugu_003852 [Takifugu bimaculatus]